MILKRQHMSRKPRVLVLYAAPSMPACFQSSRLSKWYELRFASYAALGLPRFTWWLTCPCPDAVHLTIGAGGVHLSQSLCYGITAQLLRFPTIFQIYADDFAQVFHQGSPALQRMVARAFRQAEAVLMPSLAMVHAFEERLDIPVECHAVEHQRCLEPALGCDTLERELDTVYQRVMFRNGSPGMRKWSFFWARLAEMGPGELLHRIKHLVLKRVLPGSVYLARASQTRQLSLPADLPFRGFIPPAVLVTLSKHYAQIATAPDRRWIVEEAERIRSGQRVLFTRWVQLDTPIAYDRDPETGSPWPMVAFYQVSKHLPGVDIKPVWELGKLTELARLCWIGRVLDHQAYVCSAIEEAGRFLTAHPVGIGPHWASALEVSIRTVSLLWMLTCLDAERQPSSPTSRALLARVAEHLHFLYRERSIYLDRNNHLVGEAVGLLIGGLCVPNLPQAPVYWHEGLRILRRELPRQLDSHGYDREGSMDYHRQVVEWLVLATIILRRLLPAQRGIIESYLSAALTSTCALADRYGNIPVYGDTDHARIFPLAPIPGKSVAPLQLYDEVLFQGKTPRQSTPDMTLLALTMMSLSIDHNGTARALGETAPKPRRGWQANALPTALGSGETVPGGMHRLSDALEKRDGIDLYYKVGEMGLPPHSGHAYADVLSLQLFQGGVGRLVDPGTHRYGGKHSLRPRLRRSWHHATLSLPFDQADPIGMFKWATRPGPYPDYRRSTQGVDIVTAAHNGYTRCQHGMLHRREVARIEGGTVLVIDRLGGTGTTRVTFPYPLPPEVLSLAQTPLGANGCEAIYQDGGRLTIFSPHYDLQGVQRFGGPEAMYSAHYGHIVPVYRFELSGHVALPLTVATLLHFSPLSQPTPVTMTVSWRPLEITTVCVAPGTSAPRERVIVYKQGDILGTRVIRVTESGATRLEQTLCLPSEWDV